MITGFATKEGTASFRDRFSATLNEGHFRERQGLYFSSIGMGSYLGDLNDEDDKLYAEALKQSIRAGVNVIDTAVNYRAQRSERVYGAALKSLIEQGEIKREEIIVCTKGGFFPFDGEYPDDPRSYFRKTYVDSGLVQESEIAQGCHAITPAYLEDQLNRSLTNLGLKTIDIYYLHNPETQLSDIDRQEFCGRMKAAFQWCEEKVREGKIKMYGTATWTGYRTQPTQPEYLSLQDLNIYAREAAGGKEHHFKCIQLPLNLAMPEGWILPNQQFGAGSVTLLNLAQKLNMIVVASASLLQAKLTGPFPEFLEPHFTDFPKSAQRCLQFTRSLPGVTTALVGMRQPEHVADNLKTAQFAPFSQDKLILMFQKA